MGGEDVDVAVQDAYANQKLWATRTVKVPHACSTSLNIFTSWYDCCQLLSC